MKTTTKRIAVPQGSSSAARPNAEGGPSAASVQKPRLSEPVSPTMNDRVAPVAAAAPVGGATPHTAVQVRAGPWSKRGKRMARFRTERVTELKHREADALRGALPLVHHHIERLRPRVRGAKTIETLPESAEALTAALQSALQGARLNRLSVMVEDFRQSGFHHLLTEMLVRGSLTSAMAKTQRDRLKAEIDARTLSGEAVKRGFLVFDGLAQRLALLTRELTYDLDGAPRVFLETYAGSFHRG